MCPRGGEHEGMVSEKKRGYLGVSLGAGSICFGIYFRQVRILKGVSYGVALIHPIFHCYVSFHSRLCLIAGMV